MSVSRMKLIRIIGYPFSPESGYESLDHVLDVLTQSGSFQPEDPAALYPQNVGLLPIQCRDPYREPLTRLEEVTRRAFAAVDAPLPDWGTVPAATEADPIAAAESSAAAISELADRYVALKEQRQAIENERAQLAHFLGLDVELQRLLHCETVKVRFGRLPKESYEKLVNQNRNPLAMFFPANSDEDYYWGIYFVPLGKEAEIDRLFFNLYFERLRIPSLTGTPEEIVGQLEAALAEHDRELAEGRTVLTQFWQEHGEKILRLRRQLQNLSDRVRQRSLAASHEDSFVLSGWVPQSCIRKLSRKLKELPDVDFQISDPEEGHGRPPVRLRNPALFRPFEYLVEMYGLPRYGEPDPTPFVAITYTLLFGVMFGDVGQGLLVSLVGFLMWKLKKMDIGRILIPCGISAAFFGTVFGSVFGFEHWLDPLYHTLGFRQKPIDVMEQATTVILLSVAAGLVLILFSMLLNILSSLRRKDYGSALFSPNGVAGLVFYTALIVGFGGQLLLQWHLITVPYILGLVVLPLLLMYLQEPLGKLMAGDKHWMPDNWGEFLLQTFFELFETLLSYVSNTMSFLRVGAFVLVHAGMMLAVFSIADMFGTVGYIVSVVLGNLLVAVMEALLVAIQVMRLEFYELFSRYYLGDGDPFRPLSSPSSAS